MMVADSGAYAEVRPLADEMMSGMIPKASSLANMWPRRPKAVTTSSDTYRIPYSVQASLADLGIVGDVRGSHFMQCVENVADKETKELFDPSVHVGDRVADACEKRGLIVRPIAHLNVLSPPLVLSVEQIDWMVDTLREGIIEVQADLIAEGLWSPE